MKSWIVRKLDLRLPSAKARQQTMRHFSYATVKQDESIELI